jgi:regulation of enolase protein 1 (concanavalin A-like superfamily)
MVGSRRAVLCCMLLASVADAGMVVYFEDHFDANALLPEWTAMGSGQYALLDGCLKFFTAQGDYHAPYEPTYGPPRHVFYVSPAPGLTEWMAIARVRYNTPDQSYEQVDILTYEDNDNYVKVGYESGSGHVYFRGMYETSEQGYGGMGLKSVGSAAAGFFWLRLDRQGDEYTAYFSTDSTADANAVAEWTLLDTHTAPLGDSPMVGIGGYNAMSYASGELAEFDYFRLSNIPTYVIAIYTGGLGTVLKDPDQEHYKYGDVVALTALEDYGYNFKFWKVYDPNFPGDANYVVRDNNNPIQLVMFADWEVDAIYGCSAGEALPLLLTACFVGTLWFARAKRRSVRR